MSMRERACESCHSEVLVITLNLITLVSTKNNEFFRVLNVVVLLVAFLTLSSFIE